MPVYVGQDEVGIYLPRDIHEKTRNPNLLCVVIGMAAKGLDTSSPRSIEVVADDLKVSMKRAQALLRDARDLNVIVFPVIDGDAEKSLALFKGEAGDE